MFGSTKVIQLGEKRGTQQGTKRQENHEQGSVTQPLQICAGHLSRKPKPKGTKKNITALGKAA